MEMGESAHVLVFSYLLTMIDSVLLSELGGMRRICDSSSSGKAHPCKPAGEFLDRLFISILCICFYKLRIALL